MRLDTIRNWLMAVIAVALGAVVLGVPVDAQEPLAGSQGTDTSLPLTDSAVTVNGRGRFADMSFTVNQTSNLTFQTVSVNWTGGTPTGQGPGTQFGSNFVQIMQCWGEADGSIPENPGPSPENCVFGASGAQFGSGTGGGIPGGLAATRELGTTLWPDFDPAGGFVDTRDTKVWVPFRSVDGTTIDVQTNPAFDPNNPSGDFWTNPFFNIVSTNEISGGRTQPDGTGSELFTVHTGLESSGLGCALRGSQGDRAAEAPNCWLVVVPRSVGSEENVNTPFQDDFYGVLTSPISPTAWQNRIAFPIDFNPLESPCSIADRDRRIVGSELALKAVSSWQPALCEVADLPPISYAPVSENVARLNLTRPTGGAAGMVTLARPAVASEPIIYAPLTLSGLTIAFNVERIPAQDGPIVPLAGIRVADINLTPRLVAKLLTQSYSQAVTLSAAPEYEWLGTNAAHLGADPDFVQFNPEFALLNIFEVRTFSSLQIPSGTSDAAQQVWEWILADPEAARWLSGEPDEWGMVVNPVYSTDPTRNPSGVGFGDPVPTLFPKSDPYCYQPPVRNGVQGTSICGTDWVPYARSFEEAGLRTRLASDGARVVENLIPLNELDVWKRAAPHLNGRRAMISVTDSASASLYGLQVARLSRAGDNDDARSFIAPDDESLTAGAASMAPVSEPLVREPDPARMGPGAYPLTAITYAAASPSAIDAQARAEYALFLDYAAGPGQEPGQEPGQLPRGYTPLPADLRAQTLNAARELISYVDPPDPPASPPPSPPATAPVATTTPVAAAPAVAVTPPVATQAPRSTTGPVQTPRRQPTSSDAEAVEGAEQSEVPPESPPSEIEEPTESTVAEQVDSEAPTVPTPGVPVGPGRVAVPILGGAALGSALLALELTKRPRRMSSASASAGKAA